MAVITGSTPDGSVMTAAGVHAYMQSLRGYLLSVGMEELPIPGAYDASPEGDVSQVPDGGDIIVTWDNGTNRIFKV